MKNAKPLAFFQSFLWDILHSLTDCYNIKYMNKEIKNLLTNLNRRIAELRIEAGLTQEQLAEKIGVPLRALQYWEANRTISLPYLIKLAQTLGRDPADFFEAPKVKQVKKGRPVKNRSLSHPKANGLKKGKERPRHG